MAKFKVTVVFDVGASTQSEANEAVDWMLAQVREQVDCAPEFFDEEAEWLGWQTEALTGWVRA
jgi:hypothetical protein